jgi:hypothetical protein
MPVTMLPTSRSWRRPALAILAGGLVLGCRFMPRGAHWIEGHADGHLVQLAGWPGGVVGIGMDSRLWAYPVEFGRPWAPREGGQDAKAIASSSVALYAIARSGEVSRIVDNQWTAYPGSITWGATSVGASVDDRLYVVVGGRVRRVEGDELKDTPCESVSAVVVTGVGADEIYVVDAAGALHHGTATSCARMTTPAPIRDVAARNGRVVVVAKDGQVWRRRGDEEWRALPPVRKYRPYRAPFEVVAVQVALGDYSTWLLDQEGSVFVLSDET